MIRLAVRCAPEQAERVLAELVELSPGGVEEDWAPDYVEYAIYGPPGELPEMGEIEAVAGAGLVEIESTEIPDDWADRWRDFHKPVWIGERLVVRPSWESAQSAGPSSGPEPAPIEIVVDPGRAFGTGAHATTSMCLELLIEQADTDRDQVARGAMDLGTGSGVLAIAAAKLGYAPVCGCDHEADAVQAAVANAALNGVEVTIERRNLRESPAPFAPLWIANLTAPLLLAVAELMGGDQQPELLLLSGLLVSERERVADAFARRGYRVVGGRERGEWAALRMQYRA